MTEAIDRKLLEESIAWSASRLANVDRHFFSGSAIAMTQALIDAASAHLATMPEPPKTKLINVWAIDWVSKASAHVWMPQTTYCLTEAQARAWASREADNELIGCVRVYATTREVPDDSD